MAEFDSRIAQAPPGLSAPFETAAMQLETQLLTIYRIIVLCTRETDDLGLVATYWAAMVGICDLFAGRLGRLKEEHPACGADVYYDRILDLRNKCLRLHKMHG